MLNPMCSSIILFSCITFIMLDHCLVLTMQSGRNINAAPFIPQQQQQEQHQQQQQLQQQRQWQQEHQEYAYLHGSPPYQHGQMPQEHSHSYGSQSPYQYPQHQQIQQIPPHYMDEPNFYGMPSSPPQHHLQMLNQQFPPEHLGHQFPSHHLGGHLQMVPSLPPQTFSPMHLAPMADHSSSSQLMSPLLPSHYVRDEPTGDGHAGEQYEFDDLMKNVVNFAVKSEERDARNRPIGHEVQKSRIPQGTSLYSEDPTSIVGTSKQLKEPMNPVRAISPFPTESPQTTYPNAGKNDNKEKFKFGTIEKDMPSSMADKELEKPKSRGIPPGFSPKNPSAIGDASSLKEVPKNLEIVKKAPAPPSTSKSSANEVQIKPNTVNSGQTAIPEEKVGDKIGGAQKSATIDSDDNILWKKQENSSPDGASSIKPEGTSSKNKYSSSKQKEQKRNLGKQKGNNQDQSTKVTNVAPKEERAINLAEFLLTNKGKQGKSEVKKSSDSATKSKSEWNVKFTELLNDEELDLDKIKLESDSKKEKSESSSGFGDAQDMGLEEELSETKAIEEFAKKREAELKDAKGKAKADETVEGTNMEADEKSAENREKLKAAKDLLELHKSTDREQGEVINDIFRQWHSEVKSGASDTINSLTRFYIPLKKPVDHHTEIKLLISILNYERIKGISIENTDEEQIKKDIRYLLYTVQVFYEALFKYWQKNYYFYRLSVHSYIGDVLTKIGLLYTDNGANEENVKSIERAEELFTKSMQILGSFWMIPKYREFMESQVFNRDESKYKFVKWMESFEQILDALKLFYIKIKSFNQSNAKKNGSLARLKAHFKKSAIVLDFKTILNLKFQTIFGIVFIGMDEHIFDIILEKNTIMIGLNYMKYLMPDRWAELTHTRKIMWNYFEILDYIKIEEIQADFKTHFQSIMGYPMPKGNYVQIEHGNYASDAVKSADSMLAETFEKKRKGNRNKISPEVENALNAVKEHLLCANFLIKMYEKIFQAFGDKTNKSNVHMEIHERNFWHVVDKYKCIPAEVNYRKIENSPKYQKFLQDHPMFKNTIDEAIKSLDNLFIEYNIEERRKEAAGQCECCKPEEGYDKDSEEEKERLEKEQKLEEADKEREVAEKQEIVQEQPLDADAGGEMVKSDREQ